ncbi:MAG: hypothetical protein AABY43_06900 [Candidatus Omnitrophota bacterium]
MTKAGIESLLLLYVYIGFRQSLFNYFFLLIPNIPNNPSPKSESVAGSGVV